MALGLPLKECLCVDDDIMHLLGTALEKFDETVAKSLLFIFEYIYCTVVCKGKTCMLENNS